MDLSYQATLISYLLYLLNQVMRHYLNFLIFCGGTYSGVALFKKLIITFVNNK